MMKLIRVQFLTEEGLLLLNQIPEIISESRILGLNLEFFCGGWEINDNCFYHEWKGSGNIHMAESFFKTHYGDSLKDIIIKDIKNENEGDK